LASPALPAPIAPVAQHLLAAPAAGVRAWDLPASVVLPGALLVALLFSTQYLFQPFVWRHWPVDEVLLGWLDVLRDRAITALAIGMALLAAGHVPLRSAGARAACLVAAIAIGALGGELAPVALDPRGAAHDLHLALARALQWTVVGGSIAAMFYVWRQSVNVRTAVQAAELRSAQVERQLAQVRLQVLRSRIEPHFLFNTLATVRRLHQTDPAQGARLLGHFLSYLRLTLTNDHEGRTTLGQELDLLDAYLNVVAMRMSGRLTLRWEVPPALRTCELPPLSVATLVENAVKHGIAPRPEGGEIEIRAVASGGMLEVSVADTGVGFTGSGGTGIGLASIRARLNTLYGAAASLSLENNLPCGVRARLRMPMRRSGAGA
jgi:signal transduction histidine kinase